MSDMKPTTVWIHREGLGHVNLVKEAAGLGLDPEPTLFGHHVALRVELTEDRIHHAVRLQHEPELHTVRRQLQEVGRGLGVGAGVESSSLSIRWRRGVIAAGAAPTVSIA